MNPSLSHAQPVSDTASIPAIECPSEPTFEQPAWRRALEEIWANRRARGYVRLTAEEIEAWVAEMHDPEDNAR